MKREKQQLIHDALGGDARREATLLAGARILRRRRQWRAASRGGVLVLALMAVVAVWFEQSNSQRHSRHLETQAAITPAVEPPKVLTDDQLLALFPNTPVGLVTLPDGHKRLVFPHAGDEQKFYTRL